MASNINKNEEIKLRFIDEINDAVYLKKKINFKMFIL